MTHHFVIEIAEKYGVNEAIILSNMDYWLEHNKTNGQNLHDGKYWTFNSYKAFARQFPYFSESQIYRLVNKLIKENVIIAGKFNQKKYDQTKWYTFSNEFVQEFKEHLRFARDNKPDSKDDNKDFSETQNAFHESENSISRNREMELTDSQNGTHEIVKPIPNKKPNKNSNEKPNKKQSFDFDYDNILLKDIDKDFIFEKTKNENRKFIIKILSFYNLFQYKLKDNEILVNELKNQNLEQSLKIFKELNEKYKIDINNDAKFASLYDKFKKDEFWLLKIQGNLTNLMTKKNKQGVPFIESFLKQVEFKNYTHLNFRGKGTNSNAIHNWEAFYECKQSKTLYRIKTTV